MTFQYSLRFESGERRGEVVPLTIVAAPGGTFTIGRKPGNSLQVTDASISGRHAELEVDEYGVNLRDLNSTNGTLVAGRKVRQTSLEVGDEFTLGAVEFTLLEGAEAGGGGYASAPDELVLEDAGEIELELDPAPAAAAMPRKAPKRETAAAQAPAPKRPSKPARAAAASEGLGATQIVPQEDGLEITAEDLARSAKSSKLGPILLVGLAAIGGGAWWFLGQQGSSDEDDGRRAAVAPPKAPAGNLLTAGYSFEKTDGWISEGESSSEFTPARSARRTGSKGIQADLAGGDVAVIASEPVRVSGADRSVRAIGFASADEGVELRIGLRYSDGAESGPRSTVWSSAIRPSADDFLEVAFAGTAPQGLDRVEVLLRAECTDAPAAVEAAPEGDEDEDTYVELKSISIDDVALVPAGESGKVDVGTLAVTTLASDADGAPLALAVTTLNAPLVSSVRIARRVGAEGFGLGCVPFRLAVEGGAAKLSPTSAGQLVLRGEAALVDGGIATLAEGGGYAIHGGTFEREGVTDLILGSDARMVALAFPEPVTLSARPSGGGVAFRATMSGTSDVTLRLSFMEERTRAQRLARRAKEEQSAGDSGAALATWAEFLREVPYDTRLIGDATTAQGEMLSMGRAELKALGDEVERARFFRLADLFREKLVRAEDVAARFRGSDVEAQAIALRDAIKLELSALDSDSARDELIRLEAIRSVMERDGAKGLAARIRAYASRGGDSAPKSNTDSSFGGDQ